MHKFNEFGKDVFSREEMKHRLPRPIYLKWKKALYNMGTIDIETADAIAHAMKAWALEQGATHYAHLFQPMNGQTAEKHDAFVDRDEAGQLLLRFSGNALIKGETDGSSFPNGGLRKTSEARGYTYWDITSHVFVRGHVLYIPSIFISYTGEKLDMKSPLIESVDALSTQATKLLNLLGKKEVKAIKTMIGLEQEYFLIDEKLYRSRPDLIFTGRTLIGNNAPKSQEFEDHYFGAINERVIKYMETVNTQLWRLGIYAKVEHNEVAYGQYELSALYEAVTLAVDQNLMIMDVLKRSARKHGLVCLLHEKPFSNINGSGKHNNFSLQTQDNINLFEPQDNAYDNTIFILFISLFVKVMDKYAGLIHVASRDGGNDHRLGGSEAPPAIVSVFLGEVLTDLLERLKTTTQLEYENMTQYYQPLKRIDAISYDNTDRNRTSPISFTGNKFEVRMLGSSRSAAMLNISLTSMLAYEIKVIIEKLQDTSNISQETILKLSQDMIQEHGRVIFKGDGYTDAWQEEAKTRGLKNISSFYQCVDYLVDEDIIKMFEGVNVFTQRELQARQSILYEQFNHTINTEAQTLIMMVKQDIMPSLMKYIREITRTDIALEQKSNAIKRIQHFLTTALDDLDEATQNLETLRHNALTLTNPKEQSEYFGTKVRQQMGVVRQYCDQVEANISRKHYPYPTYSQLLFNEFEY